MYEKKNNKTKRTASVDNPSTQLNAETFKRTTTKIILSFYKVEQKNERIFVVSYVWLDSIEFGFASLFVQTQNVCAEKFVTRFASGLFDR